MNDRPRRRRALSDSEREEWALFTKKIAPLSKRERAVAVVKSNGEKPPAEKQRAKAATPAPKPVPQPPRKEAPPLVPLGRRERGRITRGHDDIDGRLDLHGHTQDEAHGALLRFLRKKSDDGARLVLVITGKSGVLRRQVPLWLALPEFRALVISAEPAGARHGREGALYVRIRRARG